MKNKFIFCSDPVNTNLFKKGAIGDFFSQKHVSLDHSIIDLNGFITYRFKADVLDKIITSEANVFVVSSNSITNTIGFFIKKGYRDITPIYENADISLYQAKNNKGEVEYIFNTLSGDSYISHCLGYLLLYRTKAGQKINNEKIHIYKEPIQLKQLLQKQLNSLGISKIDTAVFSNLKEESFGLEDTKIIEIDIEGIKGKIYIGQGKQTILSIAPVYPYLYGDRAAQIASLLKDIGCKKIIFTATAGGISGDVEAGDIITPQHLSIWGKESIRINPDLPEQQKIKTVDKHTSVPTLFIETNKVINQMKSNNISSVDCEVAYIAEAIKNSNISFYLFLSISDIPGTKNFLGNHKKRNKIFIKNQIKQNQYISKILKDN